MRILFAIPHVFNPHGDGRYPSTRNNPAPRLEAFRSCIKALYRSFGPRQHKLHIQKRKSFPANQTRPHSIDILVCTTRGLHVLDRVELPTGIYQHCELDIEPIMLEFEIQALLRDRLGQYDYYCFMEDDLIIHDPWFFAKLAWFDDIAADRLALLQPNRYEAALDGLVDKLYIDGEINPATSARYQDVTDRPQISGNVLGIDIEFRRTTNPHAGAYFLTRQQLEYWVAQPHFLDRDCSFVGPLESAASLGIMKTFRIYKPASGSANFLEIEHYGDEIMSGKRVGDRTGLRLQIG
jgi:hypothetical protein